MKKDIWSVFSITDFRTKEEFDEAVEGDGQEAIKFLRGEYPKFTKFVLKGFEIDGKFCPLYLRSW